LLRDAPGQEAWFVDTVMIALRIALSHQRPMPSWRDSNAVKVWAIEATENSLPSAGILAASAQMLSEGMIRVGLGLRTSFNESWQGEKGFDFDRIVALVREIEQCLRTVEGLSCPELQGDTILIRPPRKRGYENMTEVYFSRLLTWLFQQRFDRPMDKIATALTRVTFGGKATEEGSARSRRRVAHSAKKTL
jgi:hypothetical protein